jgi:hypothetical protein
MLNLRLRHRGSGSGLGKRFIPFWTAVVCSDLSDGAFRTITPLLTLTITRSAFAVSAVGLAARLPWLLVALPAGVVVDRHAPQTVMRVAAASRLPMVALAGLLAAEHLLPVWALALIAFAVSAAGTFVDVSSQSLLPRLVPADHLRAANQRLQSTQRLASQLVGPVIGGYAAALGAGWGPGVAAILYVVVVVAFSRLPALIEEPAAAPSPARERTVRGGLTEFREGAAYFRHRPDLTRLAAIAGMVNMAYAMCLTILPIWAVSPGRLRLSQGEYGLLLGSIAIGGVAATVFARPVLAWLSDRVVLTWGGPVLGASFLVLAVPNAPIVCVSLIISGGIAMLWNLTVVSYRQTTISREVFGRVVAVYRWVTYGVLPLGSLLAGLVAGLAGVVWVYIVAGAITLVGSIALGLRRLTLAEPAVP